MACVYKNSQIPPLILKANSRELQKLCFTTKQSRRSNCRYPTPRPAPRAGEGRKLWLIAIAYQRSAAVLPSRLKRDFPEIAAALARGEFKSARAAGIAAGIVKELTAFDRVMNLLPKLTPEERSRKRARKRRAGPMRNNQPAPFPARMAGHLTRLEPVAIDAKKAKYLRLLELPHELDQDYHVHVSAPDTAPPAASPAGP
jgi:hypothetical protein